MNILKYIQIEIKKLNMKKYLGVLFSNILLWNLITSLLVFYMNRDETEQVVIEWREYYDFYSILIISFSNIIIIPILCNFIVKYEQKDRFLQNLTIDKSKYLKIFFAKFAVIYTSMIVSIAIGFVFSLLHYHYYIYHIVSLEWATALLDLIYSLVQSVLYIPLILIPLFLASELRIRLINIFIPLVGTLFPIFSPHLFFHKLYLYTPYTLAIQYYREITHYGFFSNNVFLVLLLNLALTAVLTLIYYFIINTKRYNVYENKMF